MKAKDIAKQYGLNLGMFTTWVKASGYPHKTGAMGGLDIPDDQNIEEIVETFKSQMAAQHEEAAAQAAEQERLAQERQAALANIIITSGFTFDGYTITKYSGYISGDHAIEVERGTQFWFGGATNVTAALMSSLVDLRRQALVELKESALALGCNAIIGVDFDYITLQPETTNSKGEIKHLPYVFGVTANGNAVVIEPDRR